MASAWVMGPDRGLNTSKKEDPEFPEYVQNPPTFKPELMSDSKVREKVSSSGYGKETATPRKSEAGVLPSWESTPTFKPELVQSETAQQLREKARSNGYGKELPPPPKRREVEQPKFQPEIVRTNLGARLTETAPSSGYGKITATPSSKREVEKPTFKPEIKSSKTGERLRQSARSSSYGKETAPARPRTAPEQREGNDSFKVPLGTARLCYTPRHTLLMDKPDRAPDKPPSPVFNLDCVAITKIRRGSLGGVGPLSTDSVTERHTRSDASKKIKSAVTSSSYGKVVPEVKPREPGEHHKPNMFGSPFRTIDTSADWSIKAEPIHAHEPIKVGTITAMGKKATSSNYHNTPPPTGEKREISSDPVWSPVGKSAKGEVPPAPKNSLTSKVNSNGYGVNSPAKVEREDVTLDPVWIPPNLLSKPLPPAPPFKKTDAFDHVRSHYGAGYSAKGKGGDADGDDEEA